MADAVQILDDDFLRSILSNYNNITDEEQRRQLREDAKIILEEIVSGAKDVNTDALDVFGEFVQTFGVDENGNLTQEAAQALAKYQMTIDNLNAATQTPGLKRVRSATSDDNQVKYDRLTFSIYQKMGLIDDKLDVTNLTPEQVAQRIDAVKLSDEQRLEYSFKFVDATLADRDLFESLPPSMLADAYLVTRQELHNAKTDADKRAMQTRFNTLATRIDMLIEDFGKKKDTWFFDVTNIVDVADGYEKMASVRRTDLQPVQGQNEQTSDYNRGVLKNIDDMTASLRAVLAEYDALYHLTNLNPDKADELKQRWLDLKTKLKDINASEEVLAIAANYKFLDEQGNPIPQFIDQQGQPALDYKPGYKLDEKGRLAQMFNLTRNDVTMLHVAELDKPVADIDLQTEFDDTVPYIIASVDAPDHITQEILNNPTAFRDDAYVKRVWDEIKDNGGQIPDDAYQCGINAHVNRAGAFAHRLATKIGNDKDVVFEPFKAVEDIDRLAKTRTEKVAAAERKTKINFLGRMVKNFGIGAAVSAGLTFLGKATGVAYIGAAIGTTIGVANMTYQGLKWRNEQKKAGRPHSFKDFFKDKRNWGPAVASGCAIAATISIATGNPELALGFGSAAIASGGLSSGKMVYDDAINAGYTRGQAFWGALGVSVSGALGALAGNAAMNAGVAYVNEHTDSTLFKTEHVTSHTTHVQEVEFERVYADGVIDSNERILNMWEEPAMLDARINGLMNSGLSHDDAVRYLLAFHDATDHNLGGGYFESIGMSDAELSALRNSINGTDVNLTAESMAAFDKFNPHISATNTVGYVDGAAISYDLPANAAYNEHGVLVSGKDLYSTYVNHDAPIYSDVATVVNEYDVIDYSSVFTPNELAYPVGIGTMGLYEPRPAPQGYIERLTQRAGALMDRVRGVFNRNNNQSQTGGNQPQTGGSQPQSGGNQPQTGGNQGQTGGNQPQTGGTQPQSGGNQPQAGGTQPQSGGNQGQTGAVDNNKPQKRGFFGWAKDIVNKTAREIGNLADKTVRKVQQIRKDTITRQTEIRAEKAKREEQTRKLNKEKEMTELEKINAKNKAKIEKLKGLLELEQMQDKADMDKELADAKHQKELFVLDLERRRLMAENAGDLVAAKKLEADLNKIDNEIALDNARNNVSVNYRRGQSWFARIRGWFTKPEEQELNNLNNARTRTEIVAETARQEEIRRKNKLEEAKTKRDVSEINIDKYNNYGEQVGAFVKGPFHTTGKDVESAAKKVAKDQYNLVSAHLDGQISGEEGLGEFNYEQGKKGEFKSSVNMDAYSPEQWKIAMKKVEMATAGLGISAEQKEQMVINMLQGEKQ